MVMRTLRNKVSLIIWLSAILLIALVIGLVAPNFMNGNRNLAGAAAVVDGSPIDAQQFSRLLDGRLEQARQSQGGDLSEAESGRIRREVLTSLIDEQLAFDHAKSLGQTMSPEEFRQELMGDPELQDAQGHFDQSRYERVLEMQAEQGVPWRQAELNFQRAMLLNKVRGFWDTQAVLTPADRAAAEARFNRQVKAEALVWNLGALKASLHLSDDELRTYYSMHKQQWAKPDQVKLRQIQIGVGFGDSTTTARAKAEAIWAQLKAGADFKTLAAKNNSTDAARKSSGDLGWVSRSDLRHAVLANSAFSLKKGRFSGVLTTVDGFTLLKVEDRKPGFEPTFANSRGKAAEALGSERAAEQASTLAHQALAAVAAGKSVEATATASRGLVVTTGWFGRDDSDALPALGPNPAFARQVLELDKGAWLPDPVSGAKAVAVAMLLDERPGTTPKKPQDAESRASEAIQDARNAKAKALFDAWIASLRRQASIVDQTGALGPSSQAAN